MLIDLNIMIEDTWSCLRINRVTGAPDPGSSSCTKKEVSHEAENIGLPAPADLYAFRLQYQERDAAQVCTVVMPLK